MRWRELAREVGGGFGDVGLLAPLAIALILRNHLNATAVFAGAGLFYLATALIYRLPVPVQPLKAVSAIAIAAGLGPGTIVAAGLEIGAAFVVLSVTGIADWLRRFFVRPVVRGIQLGIGLLLAKAAIDLIITPRQFRIFPGPLAASGPPAASGLVAAILVGITVLLLLMYFQRKSLAGGSLLLLGLGLIVGIVAGVHPPLHLALGPQSLGILKPEPRDFLSALWILTVPQIGLSLGNSLMATSSAAATYFGDEARRVTPGRLALSMGLANLAVVPFAGMPMCHGAGGMTAHYRTGARTGLGIAIYGLVLMALGLALGKSTTELVALLPLAVLGGFLLYVGIEHAALISDLRAREEFVVAGTIAAVAAATSNITAGLLVGFIVLLLLTPRPHFRNSE